MVHVDVVVVLVKQHHMFVAEVCCSTRKLLNQVVVGVFYNVEGQGFQNHGWPLLLKYAEANAFDTSGAHNGGGLRPAVPPQKGPAAVGRRPHLGNSLCAPLVLKVLASASIESIGHPLF